jgi:hypothetical protein
MGLSINVGLLADLKVHDAEGAEWLRGQIAAIDALLHKKGLPTFSEPETLEAREPDGLMTGFPYSFLHYLRRAYAHVREELALVPRRGPLTDADFRVIDDVFMLLDSHLLCHSDAEGFYVPIDFNHPIFDDSVAGGMLGSTQALLRELQTVAPALGIELRDGAPTPAARQLLQAADLEEDDSEDNGFWRERTVWHTLYELGSFSVAHQTLLVFG